MYGTYLRRELLGRTKQTTIVALGLAIAIALVIVVTALAAGVREAQERALESVYGVGTDLTVTGAPAEPGEQGGSSFDFGSDGGTTSEDGTTTLSQSRLMTDPSRGTLASSAVDAVSALTGVSAATAALSLTNTTFDGELPPRPSDAGTDVGEPTDQTAQPPSGGGFSGGSFDVDSFTVLGLGPDTTVGPMSAVEVTDGRLLDADDAGTDVAVVDASYASSNGIAVGDTIDVGGTEMQIVGIAESTSSEADTAANVYLPLDVAQALAGLEDAVSTVYVRADSADAISAVQEEISEALPEATVSSQSDLAATVSGSLSSASALIANLGTWLSVIVLVVALALAVLFTISGVSRRTREFGTLKAIGWSNRRVIGQVAGESLVQGLLGGAAGLLLGLGGILAISLIRPTISAAAAAPGDGRPGIGGAGGFPGASTTAATTDVVLSAPLTPWVWVAAVGIAVAAARLSPAEALRSVA